MFSLGMKLMPKTQKWIVGLGPEPEKVIADLMLTYSELKTTNETILQMLERP